MECTRSLRSGNAIFHRVSYFWGLLQSRFLFLKHKELYFWNGSQCKAFCENQFYLHENEMSFSYHRLRNKPRFETEAWDNSEIAYLPWRITMLPV